MNRFEGIIVFSNTWKGRCGSNCPWYGSLKCHLSACKWDHVPCTEFVGFFKRDSGHVRDGNISGQSVEDVGFFYVWFGACSGWKSFGPISWRLSIWVGLRSCKSITLLLVPPSFTFFLSQNVIKKPWLLPLLERN